MFQRILSYFILLISCTSCNFFSSDVKKNTMELDTIINLTKVDVSPSFIECKDFIDAEKTACFRKTIHYKLTQNLSTQTIQINDSIDEVISIDLIINRNGKVVLKSIVSSERIQKEVPSLDSLLQISIDQLPTMYPAIKRGMPVTTQYSLPVRIQLK